MSSPRVAPFSLLLKELNLCWSNCYHRVTGQPSDFEVAARIVDEERERLSLLVTHNVPLSEVGRAFELAERKSSGAVKVSVDPAR